jgi:flagellar biosynthesis protein
MSSPELPARRPGHDHAGIVRITALDRASPPANKNGPDTSRRAVALRYDPHGSTAPVVSAAGQGLVADEILRRAREAGVPITEDPQLAAVLSQIDVGAAIPPELYAVIAEVLAYVYGLDRRAGGRR